jgi:hypothetical protein
MGFTKLIEFDAYGYDEAENTCTLPGADERRERMHATIAATDIVTASTLASEIFEYEVESVQKRDSNIYIKS